MLRSTPARRCVRGAWAALILVLLLAFVSCWKVEADLAVSTNEIDFKTTKVTYPITVRNDSEDNALTNGVVTLSYQFKCDKSWLSVTPATGACGADEKVTHDVVVDRSKLELGVNLATVSITSNGGSATIKVRAERTPDQCLNGPNPAVVVYPPTGAKDLSGDVELSWAEGESRCPDLIATYDVYFGTTSPPPFDHNNDSLKVWSPGTLADNTTYYWRIVVKDANGQWTGPQWNFQTVCDLGPGEVTLLLPENNATDVSVNNDLSWRGGVSQCTGLTSSYDVYFGTTSPPPFHHNSTIKYWDPGVLAKGTTYYWKIVAKDAHGSVTSEQRSFTTIPVPCTTPPSTVIAVSPAAGAVDVPLEQDLSWSGGLSQCPGEIATYDVYFGKTSPPPLHHNNGTSHTWDPGQLDYDSYYYWRVVAKDNNGSQTTSERWFKTPCHLPPSALNLLSPADGAGNVDIGANLSWGGGNSQCPGLNATYDVYFGTTASPSFAGNTGVKYWDPGTLLNGVKYYWKIVAKDANGATSSSVRSFTTASIICTLPPLAVTLLGPDDGATVTSSLLSWSGGESQCVGLTSTYDVYFGTTSPPPLHHNNGASTTWSAPLDDNTGYYWRIVAKDANGTASSQQRSFKTPCTATPDAPGGASPANQATNVGIDSDISWTGANSTCPGLTAVYDVYFGTTSSPPLVQSNVAVKTWDPGTLTKGVTYYWQIIAKDANGQAAGSVWRFQTELPPCLDPPMAACSPVPTNNQTNRNRDVNLSWSCGDSNCGKTVTYDVYFGTTSTLGEEQKVGTTSNKAWALPHLDGLTKYYWKVITRDENGSTSSPVWNFTTKS
jgi:hypothetical protein